MMKQLVISLLLLGFALIGFTGDPISNSFACNNVQSAQSPYAGRYRGSSVGKLSVGERTGKWSIIIDKDGHIEGTEEDVISGKTADMDGAVDEGGEIFLSFLYNLHTLTVEEIAQGGSIKGTITKTRSGHLHGRLARQGVLWGDCTIEIDVSRYDSPSDIQAAAKAFETDSPSDIQAATEAFAGRAAAVQDATPLSQANPNLNKIFCSIAQYVGKGCDATLSFDELANGLQTYLQKSGYVSSINPDSIDFDAIRRLHTLLGDGVGHIKVEYRDVARLATPPRIWIPGNRDAHPPAVIAPQDQPGTGVYTPPPVVRYPPVAIMWWVLDKPSKTADQYVIVADKLDKPNAPLRAYVVILAYVIDPKLEGTNRAKFIAYFNQ